MRPRIRAARIPRSFPALLALAACVAAAPLHAQAVRGHVVEAESGAAVPSALVSLLDAEGRQRAATVSDPHGGYHLTAPRAGEYRLRIERIGYATTVSQPLALEDGATVEHRLHTRTQRVTLPVVTTTGRQRRCAARPENVLQAARVWEEARKALSIHLLTERDGRYRFTSRVSIRHLSLNARAEFSREDSTVESVGMPFTSLSARSLLRGGYVQEQGDTAWFHGVDAAAILSDEFLDHHCFGLRDGGTEQPGMVGLTFVPLAGRVAPDVQGVLWLDRATAELRLVEYGYTGLRYRGKVARLGGRLEFHRLPAGEFILRRWWVRAPLLRPDKSPSWSPLSERARVAGLVQRGGDVLRVSTVAGAPVPLDPEPPQERGLGR